MTPVIVREPRSRATPHDDIKQPPLPQGCRVLQLESSEGSAQGTKTFPSTSRSSVARGSSPSALRIQTARYILKKWPQAIQERGCAGLLPLHLAVVHDLSHDLNEFLWEEWPDAIYELSEDRESLLHVAARRGVTQLATVRFLLELDGRILDVRSEDGLGCGRTASKRATTSTG